MGLFGSSKKTYVGTQVQRVIEDGALPDAIRSGNAKNMFDPDLGGDQMIESIMDELVNSVGLTAKRMYDYGKSGYIWGLPQSSYISSQSGKAETLALLRQTYGASTQMTYFNYGAPNVLHMGWGKLVSEYGYDYATNQLKTLSTSKNTPVYLVDMQAVIRSTDVSQLNKSISNIWEPTANSGVTPLKALAGSANTQINPTKSAISNTTGDDYVIVTYCWEVTESVVVEGALINRTTIKQETMNITITGLDQSASYFQARIVIPSGLVLYWTYKWGLGTYPVLDALFRPGWTGNGGFFPFAYFRYNKQSTVSNKTTEDYKSTKKLLNYLNMDFDAIGESINANPDIADVEQAMLMMAVPAQTTTEIEQKYLFDFFSGVQRANAGESTTTGTHTGLNIQQLLDKVTNATSMVIQDKRFKMALSYSNIVKQTLTGKITSVGHHTSGTSVDGGGITLPSIGGGSVTIPSSGTRHWYRRQLTESTYEEVAVYNLKMTYWILDNYTTTGDIDNKDILMIPLDVNIVNTYSLPERELLYSRGMHFIFNSRQVVKLKWYQTGLFKALLVIVAVVIVVISWGTQLQALGAALAAGTVTIEAVVMFLLVSAVKYLVLLGVTKLFVKVFGAKLAFLAALVAMVSSYFYGGFSATPSPTSVQLLQLSTGLSKAASVELGSEMEKIQREMAAFETYKDSQNEKLTDAEDLLTTNNWLQPMVLFGENPNQFYDRTVHSGNIGILGLDAVTSYVDVALQLPTLNDTLGESV